MEVTIKINGQALSVEVSVEVYEYLDEAKHKNENLSHEQRRYWDGREYYTRKGGIATLKFYCPPTRRQRFKTVLSSGTAWSNSRKPETPSLPARLK